MQGFAAELIGEVLTHGKGPLGQLVRIYCTSFLLLPTLHDAVCMGLSTESMLTLQCLRTGLPCDRAP
jgi:hypothetical protein